MHRSISYDDFFFLTNQTYQLLPAQGLRTHLRFPYLLPRAASVSLTSGNMNWFCSLLLWYFVLIEYPGLCLTSFVKFIHIVVCCFQSFILIAG